MIELSGSFPNVEARLDRALPLGEQIGGGRTTALAFKDEKRQTWMNLPWQAFEPDVTPLREYWECRPGTFVSAFFKTKPIHVLHFFDENNGQFVKYYVLLSGNPEICRVIHDNVIDRAISFDKIAILLPIDFFC